MQSNEELKLIDNLILSYLKGELSEESARELLEWIRKSDSNKRYFNEQKELWLTAQVNYNQAHYNYQKGFARFREAISGTENKIVLPASKGFLKSFLRIAAIIVAAVSISGIIFYNLGKKNGPIARTAFNEIIVPLGSRSQVVLLDGTIVTLNAGSKLRYDSKFGINDRTVFLEGEGYFKVAKDKKHPFIVETSHVNVRALGTEFNVKAYPGEKTIETTLVEGAVKIEEFSKSTQKTSIVLKPNQKFTFVKEDEESKPEGERVPERNIEAPVIHPRKLTSVTFSKAAENVDVLPIISWKENKWIIEKQTLGKLAIELERKFDISINFKSQRLKNYRFTGTLLNEPLEQVLRVMSFTAPINYEIKGKTVSFSEKENMDTFYKKLYKEQEN